MMSVPLFNKSLFCYFRIGLVTGLLDRQSVIAWADDQIIKNPSADDDVIELALASQQPYSQMIWLLNRLQDNADIDLPIKMLLAHAGVLLEEQPERATEIGMGLRLLLAEEFLPGEIRSLLRVIENDLESTLNSPMAADGLARQLSASLGDYATYRGLLTATGDAAIS